MTYSITLWLAFCLATGVVCWFGTRGQAIAFTIVLSILLPGTLLPLGYAAPWKPAPGHYTVLGARFDVDEAIYVLLDDGGTPRLYKLPYTQQSANELQRAMDMAEGNGGTVGAQIDGEGSPEFSEEGSSATDEPKVPEAAIIQ